MLSDVKSALANYMFAAAAAAAAAATLTSLPLMAASAGPRFYGDAPDDHHPWAVHDGNRPQPKVVTPGTFSSANEPGRPPSDAVVLFDGKDLSGWVTDKGAPAPWLVKDGVLEVAPGTGAIHTKTNFGDCQLHIEWAAPSHVEGESQGRGNSGVFLMGMLEIQVLDSFNNVTYADGHAGAYYGVNPPMALPLRPPGEFQVYDIVFRRPIYDSGKVVDPGYVTVMLNGVLVQDHTMIEGPGGHMGRSRARPFPAVGPLSLQDHGNPTRFRNIWYRPLAPRPAEGGTDGYLSAEATMAKRHETAAKLRSEAAALKDANNPLPEVYGLFESLTYESNEAALTRATELADAYVKGVTSLPAAELTSKKDEVQHLRDVLRYLGRFRVISDQYAARQALEKVIKEQGWDKKK